MGNYLYINTSISLIALILIRYGKGTNNANYYTSSLAIVAWFIPYPLLAKLIPPQILTEPIIISISKMTSASILSTKQWLPLDINLWLKIALMILISIGLLLFIKKMMTYLKWKKKLLTDPSLTLLNKVSLQYQLPVYSSNKITSGILLGILKPVIIISSQINNLKYLNLIICHEKQHMKNQDNLRLLLLELSECLFWWNPFVRKLVTINRFLIEARCDESTSKEYGKVNYIEDISALMLTQNNNKINKLSCLATSNSTNNIARIKRLKEYRIMTFRKKLTFLFIALATVTAMAWNTLATANNNNKAQTEKVNPEQLGALIDFDVIISNKETGDLESTHQTTMVIWQSFNEEASIELNDVFSINFQVTDLGETSSIAFELIEIEASTKSTFSTPKLTVAYGKEAMIEIDNPELSNKAYSIKFTLDKAPFSEIEKMTSI